MKQIMLSIQKYARFSQTWLWLINKATQINRYDLSFIDPTQTNKTNIS